MTDSDLDRRLGEWRDDTLRSTAAGRQPVYRDSWWQTRRGAAAVVAAAAAVSAVTLGLALIPSSAPLAGAPVVVRTVTYDGISLDVPAAWSSNREYCGVPIEDTVLTNDGYVNQCLTPPRPVSSVEFSDVPAVDLASPTTDVESGTWVDVELDGHRALRRDSVVRTEAPRPMVEGAVPWPDITYHRTEFVIPDHEVWVTVQSPTPTVVATVAESLRVSY